MPIHLNPFRLYKGRVCLNHGLLVDILRSSQRFWVAYKDLLELNGKKESDVKELKEVMKKMGLKPNHKGKITTKKKLKVCDRVTKDFDVGLRELDNMMNNLARIILDDETFLYRAVKELRDLYIKFRHIKHLPDHMRHKTQHELHYLMEYMEKKQHHAWVISKAHSRGAFKFREVSILSERSQRRRIRRQTLELDHLRNRIEPLRDKIENLRSVRTHDDIHRLHNEITELLKLYHEEISDLSHIMHEADILIRRTEKLFHHIALEADHLEFKDLKKKVKKYDKRFHQLMRKIESQARRECIDLKKIVGGLPKPEGHKEKLHLARAA
ncbi:hypothetical protein ACFL3V_04780 [Nanoarchaeota archaeon]